MLYTGNEQETQHNPNINNNLPEVKCSTGAKVGFWILIIISIGIFYLWVISRRNQINRMQVEINEKASGIDVQLQKRYDTLTKLVDAVKSQIKFDQETLQNITAMRSGYRNASTVEKENILNNVSRQINFAFENYPQLGADSSITQLMNESVMIEKEIAASRRLYNSTVTEFNSLIYTFPTTVILSGKGYKGIPLFAAEAKYKQDVKLEF